MVEEGTVDTPGGGGSHGEDEPRFAPPDPTNQGPLGDSESGKGPAHSQAETDIWHGRTHWKHYAGRLILWLLANGVVGALTIGLAERFNWLDGAAAVGIIVGLLVVSGGFVIGRIVLIILSRRYRLTTQRLFIHRGILSQTVDQMELIRVDDVRIHKSVMDRMLGLGSIEILSTDTSNREISIEGIPNADQLAEAVRTNMHRLRSKSLYVERL